MRRQDQLAFLTLILFKILTGEHQILFSEFFSTMGGNSAISFVAKKIPGKRSEPRFHYKKICKRTMYVWSKKSILSPFAHFKPYLIIKHHFNSF